MTALGLRLGGIGAGMLGEDRRRCTSPVLHGGPLGSPRPKKTSSGLPRSLLKHVGLGAVAAGGHAADMIAYIVAGGQHDHAEPHLSRAHPCRAAGAPLGLTRASDEVRMPGGVARLDACSDSSLPPEGEVRTQSCAPVTQLGAAIRPAGGSWDGAVSARKRSVVGEPADHPHAP